MASARENDLNPNVYIGLALPIKPDDNNIFSLTKNSFDQVRHNLRNLLLTNVGERVYQPEFGSRLRELCFEQLDESLPQRVEDEVRRALEDLGANKRQQEKYKWGEARVSESIVENVRKRVREVINEWKG